MSIQRENAQPCSISPAFFTSRSFKYGNIKLEKPRFRFLLDILTILICQKNWRISKGLSRSDVRQSDLVREIDTSSYCLQLSVAHVLR